jgi:hypothetical protein
MRARVVVSLLVLAACGATLLGVRFCRGDGPPVDNRIEVLRVEVVGSKSPADVINAAPRDVRGRFVFSLAKASSAEGMEKNAEILDAFIRQTGQDEDAIVMGRNAVVTAGEVWATAPPGSAVRDRMRGALIFAAYHPSERMHSTFLGVVAEKTDLLSEADIRRALEVLAAGPETEYNKRAQLPAKAKKLLTVTPGSDAYKKK